jgi:dihydropyrimidinase
MDVAIRGGEIVTSGSRFHADIGIADEKIVQLGGMVDRASTELDARGKIVIPGGIDMHVHLSPAYVPAGTEPGGVASDGPGPESEPAERVVGWADDFQSGSRAAAAGGITTIGNVTFPRVGESALSALERVTADAVRHSIVDFVLHPVLLDASLTSAADLGALAELGHRSIKIFMMFDDFDTNVADYVRLMKAAGENGMMTLLHCEDACIVGLLAQTLLAAGRGQPANYGISRPVYSEAVAVSRAVAFCEATEAPIYIVHLSSEAALSAARAARQRQLPVHVETRPIYLFFDEDRFHGPEGALYVGNPPLRKTADIEALWAGLATGTVDTCCTDHAPSTRDDKLDPSRDITTVSPGMADLDTLMPLLYSEGVLKGRLSLERFIEVTSTNAAKLFGLYPQKGTIAIGGDADLVVWDPEETRKFSVADAFTNADFSLYEGWTIKGWPQVTISRGDVIYEGGKIVPTQGRGRLVEMQSWRPL